MLLPIPNSSANGYISKDENGIHLLREDIFYIAKMPKSNFRKKKVKSEKPIQMPIIILDWYRAVGKLLLAALTI